MTPSPSPIPLIHSESSFSDVLTGLGLPFRALGLIFRTPKLLGLSLLCALVTSGTLVALVVVLWPMAQHWADSLVGTQSTWRQAVGWTMGALLFLGAFATGALTVPNLVLAPLQDPISETTEVCCGDFSAPPFSASRFVRGVWVSLVHTLSRLALMLLGYALLAPLNLLPVIGSGVWVLGSSLWAMFWLAVEHLSNPMARHLSPFGQVVTLLRKRLFLALGFGAALYVMLWVPVVNFFLMPVAVVAGTLLYRAVRLARLTT